MPSLNRAIIAKLENGHRESIGTSELLVLAQALGVAPSLLLFPLGREPQTDVTPATSMPTWEAVRWFYGVGRPNSDNQIFDPDSGDPVALFETHDHLTQIYRFLCESGKSTVAGYSFAEELAFHIGEIRAIRTAIRRLDLIPPDPPAELPRIDDDAWPLSYSHMLAEAKRALRFPEQSSISVPSDT